MNQAQQIGQELAGMGKTLQVDILQRFLSDKQINELVKGYKEARQGRGARSRFNKFSKEVSNDEKELLRLYFNESLDGSDLAEKTGIEVSNLTSKVGAIALRLCYEKQKSLNL